MLDIIELGVSRRIDLVREGPWLVRVHLHNDSGTRVLSPDPDIVELAGGKILVLKNDFTPLESKVKHQSEVTGIGYLERKVLFADIGIETHKDAFRVSGRKADADLLGQRRFVRAGKVVLDHVVALHVYANLIRTNWSWIESTKRYLAYELLRKCRTIQSTFE